MTAEDQDAVVTAGALTHTETWTYVGEIEYQSGWRATWRRGDGTVTIYKSNTRTRGAVGYRYEVTTNEGLSLIRTEWTGELTPDAPTLQLEERARQSNKRRAKAERRAKVDPAHQDILDHAERVATGLSWEARQQLADELTRIVYRAPAR